jgi:hypothetical protein
MIQFSKNISMFAMNTPSSFFHSQERSSYFYGYTEAVICKDKGLSIHNGLLHLCCNLNLAVRGAIAFFILFIIIFHYMPSSMKICNAANNSTCTATSAHETCTPSSEVRILKNCSFSTFEKFLSCIKSDLKEDAHGILKVVSGSNYREVSFISPDGILTLQMKKGGLS